MCTLDEQLLGRKSSLLEVLSPFFPLNLSNKTCKQTKMYTNIQETVLPSSILFSSLKKNLISYHKGFILFINSTLNVGVLNFQNQKNSIHLYLLNNRIVGVRLKLPKELTKLHYNVFKGGIKPPHPTPSGRKKLLKQTFTFKLYSCTSTS